MLPALGREFGDVEMRAAALGYPSAEEIAAVSPSILARACDACDVRFSCCKIRPERWPVGNIVLGEKEAAGDAGALGKKTGGDTDGMPWIMEPNALELEESTEMRRMAFFAL